MDLAGDFDRLFDQTRRALQSVRASGRSDDEPVAQPPRGVGAAAGGQVQVVVLGQRVDSVEIDPRALRMGAELLGEQIAQAVNAALDDLRDQADRSAGAEPPADPAALAERLDELQHESVRSMAAMSQALADAVRRIQQSGRPS